MITPKSFPKKTLFSTLYNNWNNIVKSGVLANTQYQTAMKITSSISVAWQEAYDITNKLKETYCSIKEGKFDIQEVVKLESDLKKKKEAITLLEEIFEKLFWVKHDTIELESVWSMIENWEAQKEEKKD